MYEQAMRLPPLPVGRITPIIFFVILPVIGIVAGLILFSIHYYTYDLLPAYITFVPLIYVFIYWSPRSRSLRLLEQGSEKVVIAIETTKKIFIVVLPIFLVGTVIEYVPHLTSWVTTIAFMITSSLLGAVMGCFFLAYVTFMVREDLRFYFAKACFMSALGNVRKQMYYFNLGLQEYDKYLKRRLKHQINGIDTISLKVDLLDDYSKNKVIRSLSDSFQTESDRLKPLRYISSELMKSEDIEGLLTHESLKSQLRIVGTILVTSVPVIVSIITLVLTALRPK